MSSFLNVVFTMELAVANTSLSTTPINDVPATNTLAATTVYYNPAFQVATSPGNNIPIPPNANSTVVICYIKNLDTANPMSVTYQFNGGTGTTITLVPGGVFLLFNPSESTNGITSILVNAGGAIINAEVFLGY